MLVGWIFVVYSRKTNSRELQTLHCRLWMEIVIMSDDDYQNWSAFECGNPMYQLNETDWINKVEIEAVSRSNTMKLLAEKGVVEREFCVFYQTDFIDKIDGDVVASFHWWTIQREAGEKEKLEEVK